ncbi:MAG: thioredoxin family protein [bacterium]
MKKKALTAIVFAIPLLAFSVRVATTTGNEDATGSKKTGIQWTTFDKGMDQAKKEKKLLVVDFYTDWCHWCRVMDKETYGDQAVVEYAKDKIVMAKLNAETSEKFRFKEAQYSGRELSMIFGVTGFPTTVFMSADGEFLTKVSGFIPADKFRTILKYFTENWHEKMKFDEFEKKQASKNKS